MYLGTKIQFILERAALMLFFLTVFYEIHTSSFSYPKSK